VATVAPDITGVDKCFDYEIPPALAERAVCGAVVRVPLQGRRVRGWIVGVGSTPTPGVTLRAIADVVSLGPPAAVVELARFGAWRYAGRIRPFLVAASPPSIVRSLPPPGWSAPARFQADPPNGVAGAIAAAVERSFALASAVLRLPPAAPRLDVIVAVLDRLGVRASGGRDLLVLTPERRDADTLGRRLERLGRSVAVLPEQWAGAASGGRVVVGSRAAVMAPAADLGAIVVLDAHGEAYTDERSPTWNAAVLAVERARRAGIPCLLVSACPTLELLELGGIVELPRSLERAGWPPLEVIDRRGDDPRSGRYSPRLAPLLAAALDEHPELPALCVLNRVGRARLLACGSCGEMIRCARCGGALAEGPPPPPGSAATLNCTTCQSSVAKLCSHCGSTRLKTLRVGVSRAREELAALTGREVIEVSGPAPDELPDVRGRLVIGTQAALHRLRAASIVVFLDFDQELLATRFTAGEDALALIARAARLVGARDLASPASRAPGRIAVETRLPDHEVIRAALHGDPTLASRPEAGRRHELGLPPARSLALVSGDGATALAEAVRLSLEVAPLGDGRYLIRAADPTVLANGLAATGLLGSGVRVDVDPRRI